MAYIIDDTAYNLSEARVNENGTVTSVGPIAVTGLALHTVILGVAYDPALPGWRLLVATPQ